MTGREGANHPASNKHTRGIVMEFILNSKAILEGLKPDTRRHIQRFFTFENPAYAEAVKQGRWIGNTPRHLQFFDDTPAGLACPRGAAARLHGICTQHGEQITIVDERLSLDPVNFQFKGTLRPLQAQAVTGVLRKDHGTLSAPTGSGKTCMGLYIVAQRKQTALIVCHTRELLDQWIDAIEKFLGIPADQVGVIGAGRFDLGEQITVALVQSLYKRLAAVRDHVGHVVVDEAHRTPSRTFTEAVTAFPARFRLALTATPWRRDGLSRVIFWHLGDTTGKIDKGALLDAGSLCPAAVLFIDTGHESFIDPVECYSKALSELTRDQERNRIICREVKRHNGSGVTLILSDRREHCQTLAGIMQRDHGIDAAVLTGSTPKKERAWIVQDLRAGKCGHLIATGQLIGEGFDLPAITTMVLATPVKFSGRLIQYIGRALRPAPGKDRALILDFVDDHGVFRASARGREQVYMQQGIRVNESLQVGAA
jgi:superfamily II DNA or RNA helicase